MAAIHFSFNWRGLAPCLSDHTEGVGQELVLRPLKTITSGLRTTAILIAERTSRFRKLRDLRAPVFVDCGHWLAERNPLFLIAAFSFALSKLRADQAGVIFALAELSCVVTE